MTSRNVAARSLHGFSPLVIYLHVSAFPISSPSDANSIEFMNLDISYFSFACHKASLLQLGGRLTR